MRTLDDTSPRSLSEGQWLAQPRWVRLYVLFIGVPAWLVLMGGVFDIGPRLGETGRDVALGLFIGAAALQMVSIARAYWRMDI